MYIPMIGGVVSVWGWCGGLNYPGPKTFHSRLTIIFSSSSPNTNPPSQGAATYGWDGDLHRQDRSGHHRVFDSILCTCSMRARRQQYLYRSSLIWWRTVGHIAPRYRCFNIDLLQPPMYGRKYSQVARILRSRWWRLPLL